MNYFGELLIAYFECLKKNDNIDIPKQRTGTILQSNAENISLLKQKNYLNNHILLA